jgi:membrane-associated phospholipid phosphatase
MWTMRDPRSRSLQSRGTVYALREHRAAAEFARTLSTIFNPFLTATALFIIVAHAFANHSTPQFWAYSATGVVFFTIAPLSFVLYLYLTGRISDFEMSERPERERVFAGFVVIYLIAAVALSVIRAPVQLQAITWGCWGTAVASMVVTRYWKISTHAFGITGPFAAMFLLFGLQPLPYAVVVPLVCWARVYLRSHTVGQVIGGASLAVLNSLIVFRLFHLI